MDKMDKKEPEKYTGPDQQAIKKLNQEIAVAIRGIVQNLVNQNPEIKELTGDEFASFATSSSQPIVKSLKKFVGRSISREKNDFSDEITEAIDHLMRDFIANHPRVGELDNRAFTDLATKLSQPMFRVLQEIISDKNEIF